MSGFRHTLHMQPPETHYAEADGIRLAYQVWGSGDVTTVGIPNWATNVEAIWGVDAWVDLCERLTRSMRLVMYDQRGSGLSDRVPMRVDLDSTVADLLAVIDDLGVAEVVLLGQDMSAAIAVAFAARYPDRVRSMMLWGPTVRLLAAADYDVGLPLELGPLMVEQVVDGWGVTDSIFNLLAAPDDGRPETVIDRNQVARIQRQAATRRDVETLAREWLELDARAFVEEVQAPTLVMHRTDDQLIPIGHGRWLAEHLPQGRLVELPGPGHFIWFGSDRATIARLLLDFVLGENVGAVDEGSLATIVVTDIVDSTGHAVRLGPDGWRRLLDRHNALVRRQLRLRGGREWNTAGDSFLSTFASVAAAARFAVDLITAASEIGLDLRAGVHLADVEVRNDELHGLGIHVATRIQSAAKPGQVLTSIGVRDALVSADDLSFAVVGEHDLRGVPGTWPLVSVQRGS